MTRPASSQPRYKLDYDYLASAGYGILTAEQGAELLRAVLEAAEGMVGMRLSADWNLEEHQAFDRLYAAGDDEATFAWLQTTRPDYRKVVDAVLDELQQALKANAHVVREGMVRNA